MMALKTAPDWFEHLSGNLLLNEPLSKHTSWRVGGRAQYFYQPASKQDVIDLFARLPDEVPVTWLGLGSNTLVRDGGVAGVVISTVKGLNDIKLIDDHRVYAEAGVSCAKVARFPGGHGLTGTEFLSGVPGTLGGALYMNAGAFGGETWDWVQAIEIVRRGGRCQTLSEQTVKRGYRYTVLPEDCWILSGTLRLHSVAKEHSDGREKIRELLAKRNESQPVQTANAGSVFRNPEGDYAARLIEQCGLKGKRVGAAMVSDKHANFIVNQGDAKAVDIETLIETVRSEVAQQTGIVLQTEVKIIGRAQ